MSENVRVADRVATGSQRVATGSQEKGSATLPRKPVTSEKDTPDANRVARVAKPGSFSAFAERKKEREQRIAPGVRPLRPLITPAGWLIDLLDAIGSQPVGGWLRQCPAHADSTPSLSLNEGRNGSALMYCHGGCSTPDVMAALKLPMARLFTAAHRPAAEYARLVGLSIDFPPATSGGSRRGGNKSPGARGYRLVAAHDYGPAVLYRWRNAKGQKELFWETRTAKGDIPGLMGVPLTSLPLYREREVKMAVAAGEPVFVVESESSVDTLRGFYATTWAGGANNPNTARLARVLDGAARVVIIPDNDAAGLRCAAKLAEALPAALIVLPEPDQDAGDLFRSVGFRGVEELVRVAERRHAAGAADTFTIAPMATKVRDETPSVDLQCDETQGTAVTAAPSPSPEPTPSVTAEVERPPKYDRRTSQDARVSRLALFEQLDNATTHDELIAALEATDPLNFHDGRVRERFEARWVALELPGRSTVLVCGHWIGPENRYCRSGWACRRYAAGFRCHEHRPGGQTGERIASPGYRAGEMTPFCPVCGYGWDTDGHRQICMTEETP
ncbi:hypothetical protein [Plantactinospora sp. CA-290183]|uniref:hypothetical protein n=1 Tax=Plantactinospora sp. CA-290183 TaxID=3240006 RepID=UPI003D89E298